MSEIARTKHQYAFAKLEATRGELALPMPANTVSLASNISTSQTPNYSDSPEIQNTRGVLDRFADGLPAGDFTIALLARPAGTEIEPMGSPLFESLMGTKVVGGGKVTYAQSLTKPSFSICYRKGHMVYYCTGATSSDMKTAVSKKGPVQFDFSGKFMSRICMGDDNIASLSIAAASQVFVSDAKRFMVGGYVYNPNCLANANAADDNAGNGAQGYLITAVDAVNNILTVADNLSHDWAVGEEVIGWLPSDQTIGSTLLNKDSVLKIGGAVGKISAMDLTISDPAQYLEDEITGSAFPIDYVEGDRQISGSVKSYFRKVDSYKIAQGYSDDEMAMDLEFGTLVGQKVKISLPRVPAEVPDEDDSGPSISLNQKFVALETLGEDSATIYFE